VNALTYVAVLAWVFAAAGFAQPTVSVRPKDRTVSLFGDATFFVLATGDAPLSYQRSLSDARMSNMTNATR
jgi:hypothetical protein